MSKKDVYTALISGHLYFNDGKLRLEIFNNINNDFDGTDIFDSVEDALFGSIDRQNKKSHFFVALVEAYFIEVLDPLHGVEESDIEYVVHELTGFNMSDKLSSYLPIESNNIDPKTGLTYSEIASHLIKKSDEWEMNASHVGIGSPEAQRLKKEVDVWLCGIHGIVPKRWENQLEELDPEYQEYLRLKEKFSE